METQKITEKKSKCQKQEQNSLAEIKAVKTEYENLLKLYDELNSKMQRNERKMSSLESQINENLEVRGQVTSFAFRLLEQSVKSVSSKFLELERELNVLKIEKSSSCMTKRLAAVESELKSLGKSYSTLEETIRAAVKGMDYLNRR
jgi:chromosome segregation ATPase